MRYLLLGGGGFIGTHLTHYIQSQGHTVTTIDNQVTSNNEITADVYVRNPIQTTPYLEDDIRCADVVYFLAGSVGVKNVVENPYATLFNNVSLATSIVPLLRKYNKYVIFTSTSEVYGNGPFNESTSLSIGSPENLRWGYASAKLTTEFLIASSGCRHKILRLFNVAGPGQVGDYGMVIPRFVTKALLGLPIEVYGEGSSIRSFLHVHDAIRMIAQVEQLPSNGIYNIGTSCVENQISMLQLAHMVKHTLASSSPIEFIPLDEVYAANSGDIDVRVPDTTKLSGTIDASITKSIINIITDIAHDQRKHMLL